MVYYDTPFVMITWEESVPCVQVEWKSPAISHEVRLVLQKELELIEQAHASHLLLDTRKMGALAPEERRWISAEWDHQAVAAGLRYAAIIQPEKAIGRLSMTALTNESPKHGITVEYFASVDEARAWLKSV